jgi:desulfoferrodoxin-like iron-binding protein
MEGTPMTVMNVCLVCEHIEFGSIPANCPVCYAAKDKFKEDAKAVIPSAQEGKEKHVPVLSLSPGCTLIPEGCRDVAIKVGSVPHPMKSDHMIQWIDVYLDHRYVARYHMQPEFLQAAVSVHFKPEAKGTVTAVEHCNVHGTWMADFNL